MSLIVVVCGCRSPDSSIINSVDIPIISSGDEKEEIVHKEVGQETCDTNNELTQSVENENAFRYTLIFNKYLMN